MLHCLQCGFVHFQPENLRLRVIGRLKSLTLLDGSAVTEIEATSALRVAAGSRISQLSLLSHARTNPDKARSLSLMSTPHILEKLSRNKPEKIGDHDNQWYLKVSDRLDWYVSCKLKIGLNLKVV